jgi:L-ascorbate metabolism protein UlaG (beta-lactamase superfamily)
MLDRFTWFKQAAYRWDGDGVTVYIDPWGVPEGAPEADAIFITHAHDDHFQPDEIRRLQKSETQIVAPRDIAAELGGNVQAVAPGDTIEAGGIKAQAVPAYNIAEERLDKHPKAKGWVGYVLQLGDASYYHAGDTDHLPELESLGAQVAFVPIGGTYTMDVPEAASLVRAMSPQLAVPMHYGYIVGTVEDAERFRTEADPVRVEILTPVEPFPSEPKDE